ncbi:MAG: hypothetical protein IT483_08375 [Gammaproteobacteria bacterium]|nr:hypothetical protein [Gammaproteobacteria bacterium]
MSATAMHATQSTPAIDRRARPRRPLFTVVRSGFMLAAILVGMGYYLPTERYLSPEHGVGYALGIAGGSAMLLLLIYPLRKRFRTLGPLGTIKGWFQLHMAFGVAGPVLILYHSNFTLGAVNSNVALVCMLVVAGSGIFGRHFYTRIHHGLYGRKASCAELQAAAEQLRRQAAGLQHVPDLHERVGAAEAKLLAWSHGPVLSLLRPVVVTRRLYRERRRVMRAALAQLRANSPAGDVASHERLLHAYVNRRLQATRRVAEFEAYERLFSLWHVLHLPLFFMLVIAGIVHVIAVHVY